MATSKRYKLLKDLPDSNIGDLYIWNESQMAYYKDGNVLGSYWTKEYVENNPTWFEEVKDDTAEFVWTDELVKEYAGDLLAAKCLNIFQSSDRYPTIDGFKKRNITRKKIFTTEDGKDIYEGDLYWFSDINSKYPVITNCIADVDSGKDPQFKYFSTESAAKEYIDKIKNK